MGKTPSEFNLADLDLDFLPPREAALRRVGHKKTYLAQKAIFVFIVSFLVWAYFSQLHEITKGTGKIISSSRIQTINNLEGGIMREILVRDNEIVGKGQVLVRLDTTLSKSKYIQDMENYFRYTASVERLQAQIKGEVYTPSSYIINTAPAIAAQELERFKSAIAKKNNDMEIAVQDLEVKKQELQETRSKLYSLKTQYGLITEQIDITRPLADQKIYSRIDYLKIMRDAADQKSQIDLAAVTKKRQEAAVKEAQERVSQIQIHYRNDDFQELREIEGKLAEAKGAQTVDWDRLTRTEIVAPLNGIIRDIKLRTVGGVVQPGEAIMDIVPWEDTLLVEAQIAPGDVAFLHPGMPATIKVTAYDFSTFGGLESTIEDISPDTITDKREQSFYRILLRTKTNSIIKGRKMYPILPGMVVEVDILTGEKSILQYLGKPFLKALQNSMTEK
jgi:adhesin transport system membrane fusion protein